MFERWYYLRAGKREGPVTIAEAVRRAAAGQLLPQDPLWPEDVDPQMAFPASSTIDFAGLATTKSASPPPAPPKPAPPKAGGVPDWLCDVAELEKQAARPRSAPTPPKAGGLPDWLADVQVTDRFIVRGPRVARPTVVPRSTVAAPAPPTAAPTPTVTPTPPPPPEDTGYDPDTGQVLDAEKYRRWQKAQKNARAETAAVAETIYEVFLRASRALQDWLDQEANRPLLAKPFGDIRNDPAIRALVASFDQWGEELVNRLWSRLEFLVQNRRDFHASRG